jgi:GntR family transcriptional regulator
MIANPTPRYYRIYRLLKQAIESGQFPAEQAIPSENALASHYKVSRLTVRRSLELLQNEGLIQRRQGSGTYPTPESQAQTAALPADINTLMANIASMGESTQVRLLEFTYQIPSPDTRARLELPVSARVQRAVRVRYYKNQPFSYLITHVPESIGRHYTEADLRSTPLHTLFRQHAIEPWEAEQTFSATLADADQAEALGVDVGAALLCIRRTVRDRQGAPIEYLIASYNPARFEYRMALSHRPSLNNDSGHWVLDSARIA